MKRILTITIILATVLAIATPPPAYSQASIKLTTTLSNAITDLGQNKFKVASTTGVLVGMEYYVGGEAGLITAIDTTNNILTVRRGVNGTNTYYHNASDTIYIDVPANFYSADPVNSSGMSPRCSRTGTTAGSPSIGQGPVTPYINVKTGNIWDCDATNNNWKLVNMLRGPGFLPIHSQGDAAYTASIADTVIDWTTATAGRTLTLPDCSNIFGKTYYLRNDSGQTITIQGSNSQNIEGGSTVTVTTGNFRGWISIGGSWVRIL